MGYLVVEKSQVFGWCRGKLFLCLSKNFSLFSLSDVVKKCFTEVANNAVVS